LVPLCYQLGHSWPHQTQPSTTLCGSRISRLGVDQIILIFGSIKGLRKPFNSFENEMENVEERR